MRADIGPGGVFPDYELTDHQDPAHDRNTTVRSE